MNSVLDGLTFGRQAQIVEFEETPALPAIAEPQTAKSAPALLAADIKVTGQPLDPAMMGKIIKPRELVDIIELTPLSRNESILYNQLLANAWNNIRTQPVHKVLKASLRGTHDSNDRLDEAFDKLMGAWAKIRARDPQTGAMTTYRIHLLGTNAEEDRDAGYFYYTFPPDLLAVITQSRAWATIKSHIMYALRSKYSIRLYEMVERRIGLHKQYEEITVDEFRALLGVPEGKLDRFSDFNKYALKPALEEVNHLTDFVVRIATVKQGRAVEKLLLSWDKKSPAEISAAHNERERSRIGRQARWRGAVVDTTGRQIPYRLLLTKVYPLRTRVTDYAYAELERHGLPLFRTALVERSAYREMFLNGRPPTLTEKGKGAGLEIENLVAEIRAIGAQSTQTLREAV